MKNTLSFTFCLLLFLFAPPSSAQIPIALSPNPGLNGQCPGTAVTYTVSGLGTCTGVSAFIQEGTGTLTAFDPTHPDQFTLISDDIPQDITIRVTPTPSGCKNANDFVIPVRAISGLTPTITGCQDLVIGRNVGFSLTASLNYPNKGNNDPLEVKGYEWEIFSGGVGWNLTTTDQPGVTRKTAYMVTELSQDASIRVRAVSHCGNRKSDWAYCNITRFVQSPCPIIGAPTSLVAEDTTYFGVSVTPEAGLSGYTYTWAYPSGWTGFSGNASAIVMPNGLNGGEITLIAHAYGKNAVPCTVNIPLEPIVPTSEEYKAPVPAFQVYPNPASTELQLHCPTAGQIRILDTQGRTILERSVTGGVLSLPLANYPLGLYFIQFSDGKSATITRKVVIEQG